MSAANGTKFFLDTPQHVEDLELLRACADAVEHQREMLLLLAKTLELHPNEVFYAWMRRSIRQRWQIAGTDWKCFFHGAECDLENTNDGRNLRLDFGPGGRVDTFTQWGVLRYLMTSVSPWPEYPDLRVQFAERGDPTNSFGGSMETIGIVWDRLAAQGAFEPADADLVEFRKRLTTKGADGIQRISYPADTSEETSFDCSVSHRSVISLDGKRMLARGSAMRQRPASPN